MPTASLAALPSGNGGDLVSVLLTHEISEGELSRDSGQFLNRRAWTILPLLPHLLSHYGAKSRPSASPSSSSASSSSSSSAITLKSWVFFLLDETIVDLRLLLRALSNKDPVKDAFLGRPLIDQRPTVIHHYAFHENVEAFRYPDFASGFVLSMPLIKTLAPRWAKEKKGQLDFAIDPKHELAKFIWNQGKGVSLQALPVLCGGMNVTSVGKTCATYYQGSIPSCPATSGKNVDPRRFVKMGDVAVAVKTYRGFHDSRIPVVKETLEKEISTLISDMTSGVAALSSSEEVLTYFSDLKVDSIPTKDLGVKNTKRGHCAKTMAIFQYYSKEFSRPYKWLAIIDDDTLMSFRRLVNLLSCYDSNSDIALGERYGYGLDSEYGYDYITGGGGMIFSKAMVEKLADCHCRKDDAPDDMHIGMCLSSLDISVVHSPRFHQARPMDYAQDYLLYTEPISFHKHEEHDPIFVWHEYLNSEGGVNSLPSTHDEL